MSGFGGAVVSKFRFRLRRTLEAGVPGWCRGVSPICQTDTADKLFACEALSCRVHFNESRLGRMLGAKS